MPRSTFLSLCLLTLAIVSPALLAPGKPGAQQSQWGLRDQSGNRITPGQAAKLMRSQPKVPVQRPVIQPKIAPVPQYAPKPQYTPPNMLNPMTSPLMNPNLYQRPPSVPPPPAASVTPGALPAAKPATRPSFVDSAGATSSDGPKPATRPSFVDDKAGSDSVAAVSQKPQGPRPDSRPQFVDRPLESTDAAPAAAPSDADALPASGLASAPYAEALAVLSAGEKTREKYWRVLRGEMTLEQLRMQQAAAAMAAGAAYMKDRAADTQRAERVATSLSGYKGAKDTDAGDLVAVNSVEVTDGSGFSRPPLDSERTYGGNQDGSRPRPVMGQDGSTQVPDGHLVSLGGGESRKEARDRAWAEYYRKTADKTLDQDLAERSEDLALAKRKVAMSDYAITLNSQVERYLEPVAFQRYQQSVRDAIDRGADKKTLDAIARRYMQMTQAEHEAEAARFEEIEAYAQLGEDVGRTVMSLSAMANPTLGVGLEAGVAAATDGVSGGVKAIAREKLPVNTLETIHNGGSYVDIMMSLFADAGNTGDLVGGIKSLRHVDGSPPKTAAGQRSGAIRQKFGTDPEALAQEIQQVNMRSGAFLRGRIKAMQKIDDFEAALKKNDPDALRKALLDIQQDKHALQTINQRSDAVKSAFKKDLKEIYDKTDAQILDHFEDAYKTKLGNDFVKAEVVKPTNKKPSGQVNVSYDRDVTVRVTKKMPDGSMKSFDVPAKDLEKKYDEVFYEVSGGKKHAPHLKPAEFGRSMDQELTDRWHTESYGSGPEDLDVALDRPDANFSSPEQIGMAMAYKSDRWYNDAESMYTQARQLAKSSPHKAMSLYEQAEAAVEEGMRQTTKQYDNLVQKRVAAVNDKLKRVKPGAAPVKIPQDLEQAVGVMKRVGTGPHQGLTPSEAQHLLKAMGWTPSQVAHEAGKFVESLQKLSPV